MTEILTEAIVLEKNPAAEHDARVTLYTKELGRITAKATGARKITSKLNAHLEPLNLSQVRLVHKNRFQITDALTIARFKQPGRMGEALAMLDFIKEMTADGDSDYGLWQILRQSFYGSGVSYRTLLRALGFDPQFAVCESCGGKPEKFSVQDLAFYCQYCVS